MRKGKFKFTNKEGVEEQVALETLLDQIVDSPIRALMPNTEYKKGEIVFFKQNPLFFAVCVGAGQTDGNIRDLMNASNYGVPTQCGTATFIVHVTIYIPTQKDLDAYAKLESPHLTGTPTAPTASSDTNTTQIATTEFVKTALASVKIPEAVTVGTVIAFAGNSVPSGYLMCNGAAVSRTTYAALYKAIGTTYGTGNGSTTFNLPNLVDKFVQGSNTVGTAKIAGLPNITGSVASAYGEHNTNIGQGALSHQICTTGWANGRQDGGDSGDGEPIQSNTIYIDASHSSGVYGNSSTVQPPALTMRYLIKY